MINNFLNNGVLAFIRVVTLVPLVYIFLVVTKTYWEKRNKINGLRKVRTGLMLWLGSLVLDSLITLYLNIMMMFFKEPTVAMQLLRMLDKVQLMLMAFGIYYLFRHATKEA